MKRLLPAIKTGMVLLGVLTVATVTTGCASILSGTTQTVRIESEPPGATVMIKNIDRGKTPVNYSFSKNRPEDAIFELQLDGYVPYVGSPHVEGNPLFHLNIFNLFIGGIIDTSTGAITKYDDVVHVQLLPISKQAGPPSPLMPGLEEATPAAPAGHTNSDDVYERLQKLKDLKDKGIITDQEYEARRKPLLEKL